MNKSESITEISKALNSLGSELGNAKKNASNPFYKSKYADLASILNYVKPELAKHGLSVIQSAASGENNIIIVETLITHISGEWIETDVTIPAYKSKYDKDSNLLITHDAQTVGSAFTYGRRYGLSAALNISSEDDTDGNDLVDKPSKPSGAKPNKIDFEDVKTTISDMDKPQVIDYALGLKEKYDLNVAQKSALDKIFTTKLKSLEGK